MSQKPQSPRLFPLLLLALSLLLASCGEDEFHFDPYTGTDGMSVEFLDNAPPEELFTTASGEPLEIGLQVFNEGAFDVPTAYLTLATEQEYVTIDRWDATKTDFDTLGSNQERIAFPLEGKSIRNPFGTDRTFSVFATARIGDKQTETLESQLLASVCYPYQTEVHGAVCIDTDPNDLKNRIKSCTVSELSFSGQGAPVAVTNIQTRILSAGQEFIRPQFIITVENRGDGTVLSSDDETISFACSEAAVNAKRFGLIDVAEVSLSGFTLSKGQFECQPTPIRLKEDAAEITCTLKPGLIKTAQDTFSTDLSLKLKYGYITTASKTFRLTNPNP